MMMNDEHKAWCVNKLVYLEHLPCFVQDRLANQIFNVLLHTKRHFTQPRYIIPTPFRLVFALNYHCYALSGKTEDTNVKGWFYPGDTTHVPLLPSSRGDLAPTTRFWQLYSLFIFIIYTHNVYI